MADLVSRSAENTASILFFSVADVASASFASFCPGFREFGVGFAHFQWTASDMVVRPVKAKTVRHDNFLL